MKNDSGQFEDELKAMLGVEPSPGLRPRIRERAYSAGNARRRWVALGYGLTVATAGVLLAVGVGVVQHSVTDTVPTAQMPVTNSIALPTVPPVETTHPRPPAPKPVRPKLQPNPVKVVQAAPVATTQTEFHEGEIGVPPFATLELTGSLQPLPEMPVLSVALLEPINIEPLDLAVHHLGEN